MRTSRLKVTEVIIKKRNLITKQRQAVTRQLRRSTVSGIEASRVIWRGQWFLRINTNSICMGLMEAKNLVALAIPNHGVAAIYVQIIQVISSLNV